MNQLIIFFTDAVFRHQRYLSVFRLSLVIFIVVTSLNYCSAQIGIFTTSPDASAALDLYSTHKGLLIPRITLSSNLASPVPVSNPASGLLVFNIGTNQPIGFYYWNSGSWSFIKSPTGSEVNGPTSSTNNAMVRFYGTSGKTIQNSQVIVDDNANITSINNLTVNGFTYPLSPSEGLILVSNASGHASWESAPPIDIEKNDTMVTANADQLNFEEQTSVIPDGNYKATIRIFNNSVLSAGLQVYCDDSININPDTGIVTIPWNEEGNKDRSIFAHSNTTNPSRIYVNTHGIYEINYALAAVNINVTRKTVKAQIRVNGTTDISYATSYVFSYQDADLQVQNVSSSFLIELNANDYIELYTTRRTRVGLLNLVPMENVFFISLARKL